jgi:RNA polymerase II subunit A-like phosphatase
MWTRSFGATLSPNLSKSTTHVIAYKDRRTNKVRQAAKHPHIKIVTLNWLFECFARWVHADEQPYLIEVDDDNRPAEALPREEFGSAFRLSEDEDGVEEETTHIDENEPPVSPIEDIIPGEGDWGDMDAELKEFMGSDTEDSEDDGNNSDASNGSQLSTPEKKRKRDLSDDEGDGEELDGVNGQPDSKLQRRKKRAMERTSSLTQVVVLTAEQSSGLPSPETTGPEEEEGDAESTAKTAQHGPGDSATALEDEDDEDAMERAMLAEFAREDDEDGAS